MQTCEEQRRREFGSVDRVADEEWVKSVAIEGAELFCRGDHCEH